MSLNSLNMRNLPILMGQDPLEEASLRQKLQDQQALPVGLNCPRSAPRVCRQRRESCSATSCWRKPWHNHYQCLKRSQQFLTGWVKGEDGAGARVMAMVDQTLESVDMEMTMMVMVIMAGNGADCSLDMRPQKVKLNQCKRPENLCSSSIRSTVTIPIGRPARELKVVPEGLVAVVVAIRIIER